MKKVIGLVLAVAMILSMSIPAYAAEAADENVLVQTWESSSGETYTCIITKGDTEVMGVVTDPKNEGQARGFITKESDAATTASTGDTVEPLSEVSEYFYMRIYNSSDQIVSIYKVTVDGKVTSLSRKVTSVSASRYSGDTCTVEKSIDGNVAYVTLTHSTAGYYSVKFTLNWDGTFTAEEIS